MPSKINNYRRRENWFFSRFLNNKIVVSLAIILLALLTILVFTKIAYLFTPIVTFIKLIAFPIILSGVLYYLFEPLVSKIMALGVQRKFAIWIIFIIIIILLIWGISTLVPALRQQGSTFIENIPNYNLQIREMIQDLPFNLDRLILESDLSLFFNNIDWNSISEQLNGLISSTFGGIGSVIGTVAQIVTGIVTMPVILYYLLLDGYRLPNYILYHIPTKYRESFGKIMFKSNHQVSQYIRGQILVAITVGVLFAIGYALIGIDYAISLAVIAGLMNVIPYLGSIIAVVPALVIGLLTSPYMFIKVIIVVGLEQLIEGRIVSPQILGSNLKIHPITILFILLGGARLFGLSGLILAVPGYAVIKVVFIEIYHYIRENSQLYSEEVITYDSISDSLIKEQDQTEE